MLPLDSRKAQAISCCWQSASRSARCTSESPARWRFITRSKKRPSRPVSALLTDSLSSSSAAYTSVARSTSSHPSRSKLNIRHGTS